VAASINGENHGDEEDNWAQDCADGAQNCPQDGPRYSQDGTEGNPRCSQDWTESGPRYSQGGPEGGACDPQDSAKAYIADSIANDKGWIAAAALQNRPHQIFIGLADAATGLCFPFWGKRDLMDFKQFYLSPQGRVTRKQFWLWLVLPLG
jgi:hypothetical protein